MSTVSSQIDHLLNETRRFAPPAEFAAQAVATTELYEQAAEDLEGFWADRARELVHWHTPFTEVLDWPDPPFARWFADCRASRPSIWATTCARHTAHAATKRYASSPPSVSTR